MTQAVAQVRNTVSRSGFTNPLPLGVLVSSTSEIEVYADTYLLAIGTNYIVDGIGDPDGVSITIIGADDPNNYVGYLTFTAVFSPALNQQTDLSPGGVLGRSFESALDTMNRQLQSLADRVDRALKMGPDIDWSGVLPPPVDGAYPMWDADTQAFIWAALGTAAAQPLDADLSAIAALSTSAYGRSLLTLANQAGLLALLPSYQPLDSDLTSWGAITRATGFDALAATPSSANLRALLTDETGTGLAVFATAPTLVGVTVQTSPITLTSGQIAFPATQVPSANANTLDDYEEGTWTPVFSASGNTFNHATQYGRYTKIGNLVHFQLRLVLGTSGNTLTASALSITGLPFANGSSEVYVYAAHFFNSGTSLIQLNAQLAASASALTLNHMTAAATNNLSGGASNAVLSATAGSVILINGCYTT